MPTQAADVGVGIMGKEGRQAVNNSDYAVAQFRCSRCRNPRNPRNPASCDNPDVCDNQLTCMLG